MGRRDRSLQGGIALALVSASLLGQQDAVGLSSRFEQRGTPAFAGG